MKYTFYLTEVSYLDKFFADLYTEEDCDFVFTWGTGNFLLKFFRRLILSFGGNKLKEYFFKEINRKKIDVKSSVKRCYIFELGYFTSIYDNSLFNELRKNENINLVLLTVDSTRASSKCMVIAKKLKIFDLPWDSIFTYDETDSKMYGWSCFSEQYSSRPKVKGIPRLTDAYFIATLNPDREQIIMDLADKFIAGGVDYIFDLNVDRQRMVKKGIKYRHHFLKYDKMCRKLMSTNCIVEIVKENQTAPTLRWFEAIYYNKKLLTNNPRIFDLPYYDPRYMKYFKAINDVDVEWIKEKITVDYGYSGDLSIKKLLPMIKESVNS